METLIVHTEDAAMAKAVKTVLKAMGVCVEKQKKNGVGKKAKKGKESKNEKPYNPEFVAKIKQGEKDIQEGMGIRIKLEELWK